MHLGDLWHPVRPASPARIAATAIGFPAAATGLALAINRTQRCHGGIPLPLGGGPRRRGRGGVGRALGGGAVVRRIHLLLHRAALHVPGGGRGRRGGGRRAPAGRAGRGVPGRARAGRAGANRTARARRATPGLPRSEAPVGRAALEGPRRLRAGVARSVRPHPMRGPGRARRPRAPGDRGPPAAPQEAGPTEIVPIAIGETPFGTVRAVRRPGAHAFTADGAWTPGGDGEAGGPRDRARAPGHAGATGAARRGDQPDPGGAVLERHARSPNPARVDQGVGDQPALGDGRPRRGAATRTAHHRARGDRSPQPRRRQPDGSGEDPGGRAGARPRARRGRRAGAGGRRADAAATRRGQRAIRHPPRSARRVRRPGADRSGPHQPPRERRPPFAAGRRDPRSRPRRSSTWFRCAWPTADRASRRATASACSRRSIVGTPRPSDPGAVWGSRSRARSSWPTAARSGWRALRAGERSIVFELPIWEEQR